VTALHAAASQNHLKVCETLLNRGANPHIKDNVSWAAWYLYDMLVVNRTFLRLLDCHTNKFNDAVLEISYRNDVL
jgi:ankyrin repeat protein